MHRVYGLDLVDFFRRRYSWRKLATLIGGLPSTSALAEAQLNDPEFAEWLIGQPSRSRGPRVSEFSPDVARLTDIYDRLGELIAAVVLTSGGKIQQPQPSPRPRTAVDRLKDEAHLARHRSLVAEVQAAQARFDARREDADASGD